MRFRSGKGIAAMDDSYISIRIGAVRLRVIMQPVAFDHGGMGAHFGIARNRDRLIALNLNPRAKDVKNVPQVVAPASRAILRSRRAACRRTSRAHKAEQSRRVGEAVDVA